MFSLLWRLAVLLAFLSMNDVLSKAGQPEVYLHATKGTHEIRCKHFAKLNPGKGDTKTKYSTGYPSLSDAQAEAPLFRYAVDKDGAKNWQPFMSREGDGRQPDPYQQAYTAGYVEFLAAPPAAPKRSREYDGPLIAPKKTALEGLNKVARQGMGGQAGYSTVIHHT
jgi:hypothetical protein